MLAQHYKIGLLASVLATGIVASTSNPAGATLTISSGATNNVSCSGGVCVPTASDAVLNVGKLKRLLASGNVVVTTSGGTGVRATDLAVIAGFSWSSSALLTLDAYHSLSFSSTVSVKGAGGVALLTNDGGAGGALSFGQTGRLTFAQLSSLLSINGNTHELVNSIPMLASAVANNPAGLYALAANYKSGTRYSGAPIPTPPTGAFEGLGNTISRLQIVKGDGVGLFVQIGQSGQSVGSVSDLRLVSATIKGLSGAILAGRNYGVVSRDSASGNVHATACGGGGLVGGNEGIIASSWSSGSVYNCSRKNVGEIAGGLAGANEDKGTIVNSYSTANVSGCAGSFLGGLVGYQYGVIEYSFATGTVTGNDNGNSVGVDGGLVGSNFDGAGPGQIIDCYSFGAVSGGLNSDVGGLVGYYSGSQTAALSSSYSTGFVSAGENSALGGFIGSVYTGYGIATDYWDTDTSGTSNGVGHGSSTGVTGLTTAQFQSGLPSGFDPNIWAETSGLNTGFPYLIANPPP